MLGLDKGGRCEGHGVSCAAPLVNATRAYLHRRENVTNTYAAVMKPVKLLDGSHRHGGRAVLFGEPQPSRNMRATCPLERQAHIVRT